MGALGTYVFCGPMSIRLHEDSCPSRSKIPLIEGIYDRFLPQNGQGGLNRGLCLPS